MFHQKLPLKPTFVLILYMRLFLETHVSSNVSLCSKCKCDTSQNIDCINRNLYSVPKDIPPNVVSLDLESNYISKIDSGSFVNLTSLQTLSLSWNNISKIDTGSFVNLPSLQTLYLNSNKISKIDPGSFVNLTSLQKLYLYNNKISKIDPGSFVNLTSLQYLNLESNYISKIDSGSFVNLTSLQTLNLLNNNISKIDSGSFVNLTSLQTLYLYNNKISKIDPGSFVNLTSLQELYLNTNNISKIDSDSFVNLTSLQELDLGNNRIQKYEDGAFLYLPNISRINLRGNKDMMCGCHLPAVVNYTKTRYNRTVDVLGECHTDLGNKQDKMIPILKYSKCKSWTNSFVFHLIYNSTFKRLNENSTENISRVMEHELLTLLTLTGAFKVEYCGLEKKAEMFTIYSTVLSKNTKDVLQKNYQILKTSQTLRNLGIQQRNVKLIGERVCNENTTSTNNDTFYWPMTKIGTNVTIPCHANVATRHCSSRTAVHLEMSTSQYMPSRNCSPFTGIWQKPDMSQCYNTELITRELKNITSEVIDEENVEDISSKLLNISEKSVYFKEEDIDLAVDTLEKMVPLISNVSANITLNNILVSVNKMINTPEKIWVEAEQSDRSVSRMLNVIETISEKIPLEEQQVTVLYSNVGIGVIKVEKDTFNGLVYAVSYGTNETEAKNTVIFNDSNSDSQVEVMNFISLPKNLLKQVRDENRTNISRISFFSMKDDKLYRVIQKSSTKANTKINSHIIAANIPNVSVTSLDEPIKISFNLINQDATNPQCVYWDESPGQNPYWSTKGCKTANYVPREKVLCFCNHLTSFALLMDVYQNEGDVKNTQLLSIISNIGCGISFVCLILTAMIHIYFKTLWKLMASKILVNLCISLAATYLFFLVGFQEYSTKITAVCKAMAALVHYFLLTSFMWMSVEAFHVFLGMVVVFQTYQSSFLKKCSILVWGLPAVIVIITLAINYTNNYIKIGQVCWLSNTFFYAAFLAPVAIILIFNLTSFSLVIWRLITMQHDKKFEHKPRKIRIFGIVGLCFLLGLTWVLAFFAFGEAAEVFKFSFAIINALQGMFILIFYCIYKKDARDVIYPFICKRIPWNRKRVPKNTKGSSSGNETGGKTEEVNL